MAFRGLAPEDLDWRKQRELERGGARGELEDLVPRPIGHRPVEEEERLVLMGVPVQQGPGREFAGREASRMVRLRAVEQVALTESCPKTATYRSLRFYKLAALVLSASTILILKIDLGLHCGCRRHPQQR